MNNFYTYIWLREDKTPYYIGKGRGRRAFRSHGHTVHAPPDENRIHIYADNLSEEDAFTLEIMLIAKYGRLDLATGCLRNRTNGGDGQSGLIQSAKQRKAVAESNKRRAKPKIEKIKKPAHKIKYSNESKERMRLAQLHSWATKRKGKFRKARIKKIPTCHPEAKYQGKGLCVSCYMKDYFKNKKEGGK